MEEAVKAFLDECLERGSRDNMTLMILLLNDAPTWVWDGEVTNRPDVRMVEEQKRVDEEKRKKASELPENEV